MSIRTIGLVDTEHKIGFIEMKLNSSKLFKEFNAFSYEMEGLSNMCYRGSFSE